MTPSELEQSFRKDPTTSDWLRQQLDATLHRDPVDAINDAEALLLVLKMRLEDLLIPAQINSP